MDAIMTTQDTPNSIGQKYADIAQTYLESQMGTPVNADMIHHLGTLLSNTSCELVGIGESAGLLFVSKKRIFQIRDKMPDPVAELKATPVWLSDDILKYHESRNQKRGPNALRG